MGILQARILEWVACPSPRDLPDAGMEPGSPTSWWDSLPAEPPEQPCWCGDSIDNERWRKTGRVFSRDSRLGPAKRLKTDSEAKPHCSGTQGGFSRDACPDCGGETSHFSSLRLWGRAVWETERGGRESGEHRGEPRSDRPQLLSTPENRSRIYISCIYFLKCILDAHHSLLKMNDGLNSLFSFQITKAVCIHCRNLGKAERTEGDKKMTPMHIIPSSWKESEKVAQSCPTLRYPMDYMCPWNSPGQNTGVGSLSLLQGILPT